VREGTDIMTQTISDIAFQRTNLTQGRTNQEGDIELVEREQHRDFAA